MQVKQDAVLVASRAIHIAAPVELVWSLASNLEGWPVWQPDIASVEVNGDIAPGTTFRWKTSGMTINSTLQEVEPLSHISWTGNTLGMHAVHHWHLAPVEDGTRVTTEESLDGWLVRLIALFDKRFLEKALDKSLHTLKTEAERIAPSP